MNLETKQIPLEAVRGQNVEKSADFRLIAISIYVFSERVTKFQARKLQLGSKCRAQWALQLEWTWKPGKCTWGRSEAIELM